LLRPEPGLAAVVSSHAEKDFDLGLKVNLDITRHLLEACRNPTHGPTVCVYQFACLGKPNEGTGINAKAVSPLSLRSET
jgi:nucleoside-diphosphate-sugar epimerase